MSPSRNVMQSSDFSIKVAQSSSNGVDTPSIGSEPVWISSTSLSMMFRFCAPTLMLRVSRPRFSDALHDRSCPTCVMTFIFLPLRISLTKSLTTALACCFCCFVATSLTTDETPLRSWLMTLLAQSLLMASSSNPLSLLGLRLCLCWRLFSLLNLGSSPTCDTICSPVGAGALTGAAGCTGTACAGAALLEAALLDEALLDVALVGAAGLAGPSSANVRALLCTMSEQQAPPMLATGLALGLRQLHAACSGIHSAAAAVGPARRARAGRHAARAATQRRAGDRREHKP
mmetsp:Transcript_35604/g.82698  ORF Transcript_35604/g.82698 Transcript_35604/m.82698 type:complete len:288 (+) Transcript_35604:175-1038(+)